jgi:hypothetical protein
VAGLRDEVELDVAKALRDIDRLGAALTQQTQRFRRDLAASLDTLRVGPKVDTSSIDRARRSTQGLTGDQQRLRRATDETTAATGKYGRTLQAVAQVRVVQGLIAFFGGRALVGAINQTVQAASNLNEEMARTEPVFEDSRGAIQEWANTATTRVALARGEALKFANDFGNMFRGAGLAADNAADLSKTFVQLGADIASFSNLTIEEALTKLSAGLAGEIEPLRRIGFGFNDLEVQAKATALGLRDANGELTEGAKLQARIAVIMEKTRLAQGDLARTSDSLANQQRFLRAEAGQLREELGAKLTPVFLELVREMRSQLPVFGELATNLIPLLVSSLRAGIPIVQAFLQILVTLSPVLVALAHVIDALPQPILQAAVAFGLLGTGLGPLPNLLKQFSQGAIAAGGTSLNAITGGLRAMNPWVLGLTVGIPILTSVMGALNRRQREAAEAAKAATAAFRDQATSVDDDVQAIARQRLEANNQLDDLRRLGISVREFAAAAATGRAGYRDFVKQLIEGGELRFAFSDVQSLSEAIERYGSIQNAVVAGAIEGNTGLLRSYDAVGAALQKAAQDQITYLVVTEQVTAAQARAAERNNTDRGVTNFVDALRSIAPAAADALSGVVGLGEGTEDTSSAMEDLDKALGKVKDQLDATFGRFLDAEQATLALQDATHELAAALGEGAREGESAVEFANRLRGSTIDLVRAVEDRAVAMARAGQIEANAASIQAEMRRQLGELIGLFPELRGQLGGYVGLLERIPPSAETTVTLDNSQAMSALGELLRGLALVGAPIDSSILQQYGGQVADGIAGGIDANLDGVADAGRNAGARAAEEAADEVERTLRRSGRTGLNLGGFLVEGISLGAKQAEVDLRNFFNGMTVGLEGVVADAMRISPQEASGILEAVAAMDEATRDLADARSKLGADSIEAKLAELALADAQADVNDAVAEAIDSTEAYAEALDKVTESIDTMTGSLRALNAIRDAQKAARDAQKEVTEEQDRLGLFDRLIAEQRAALEAEQRRRRGGEPTQRERDIQVGLQDLLNRRGEQVEKLQEAQDALNDSNIDLIDAQARLIELGGQVGDAQARWEGFFRSIATSAGLSQEAVEALVASIQNAANIAGQVRTGVLTGQPVVPNLTPFAAAGAATPNATGGTTRIVNNYFTINEAWSGRATAVEVVDEIRSVELV